MVDLGEKIAEAAVNAICNHPSAIGWALAVFAGATLINSGIRFTWTYAETPRPWRFVLGVTQLFALNFDHFAAKFGIRSAAPDSVSPSATADAVKRDAPP